MNTVTVVMARPHATRAAAPWRAIRRYERARPFDRGGLGMRLLLEGCSGSGCSSCKGEPTPATADRTHA